MLPSESPFPCCWKGTALENIGLGNLRPRRGTYGRYSYEQLPPLPIELRGDFSWLAHAPIHRKAIRGRQDEKVSDSLKQLCISAAGHGLHLPREFITFLEDSTLGQRIRVNTGCVLELSSELARAPKGSGYLALFLIDCQGCGFWYLYLDESGKDHAIVTSSDCFDKDLEKYYGPPPERADIWYVAESFETFMCRCWIENELWFAGYEKKPISDLGQEYIARYQSKAAPGRTNGSS